MIGWLIDTNVVASLIAPNGAPSVKSWGGGVDENKLYLSILTLAEYDKGIANLADDDRNRSRYVATRDALEARFRGRILPLANGVVRRWGAISGQIKRDTGRPPSVIDTLLAATAIEADLYLVSRNVKDLRRSGAAVFDPWNDDPEEFPISPSIQSRIDWPEGGDIVLMERSPMQRVESSMMTFVDYNDDSMSLDITFSSGKTYRYFAVPAKLYAKLLEAESKGQFFNERIKDVFPFAQVRSRSKR